MHAAYPEFDDQGVDDASHDGYKIECIPRIFEKVLLSGRRE